MLTLQPAAPKTTRQSETVILDGQEIGAVDPHEKDQWWAKIRIPVPGQFCTHVLIQGFADDKYEAVLNAIEAGIREHENAAAAIRRFRQHTLIRADASQPLPVSY